MRKSEFRKLALVILSLAAVGMLAACSGSSSSTDDALSHPGENYMGSLRFDVDPQAAKVNVTPTGSPWSSTKIPGDGSGNIPNVTISTVGAPNWNAGTGSITFNTKLYWNDPDRELNNVRIGINYSTRPAVVLSNSDKCVGPIGTCVAGSNDPAITYVSDDLAEGPVSYTFCNSVLPIPTCVDHGFSTIHQGCGSVTAKFVMTEAAGSPYSFWADLYGDAINVPADLTTDPRYDQYTASIYLRTYKLDPADSSFPAENAATKMVKAGEWFYVHFYVDFSGNNQPVAFDPDLTEGPRHIEDTGNMAAKVNSGFPSTANYWTIGQIMPMTVRWDPAIIEVIGNDTPPTYSGLPPTAADSTVNFRTQGAAGTILKRRVDPQTPPLADGYNASNFAWTISNSLGMFKCITDKMAPVSGSLPPSVGNGLDGFANIDWNVMYVPIKARNGLASGSGTFIYPAFDSGESIMPFRTDGTPYNAGNWQGAVQVLKSTSWPAWCDLLPNNICDVGQYNMERQYICIE